MANGVPVFLEQVGEALRLSKSSEIVDHEQIDRSAARHGRELHRMGLTLAQVVHEYGDVCQVVSELAIEHAAPISAKDFGTLSLCLDDAIASAVTAYSHASERAITDQGSERTGGLARALRSLLTTGPLASESMKTGNAEVDSRIAAMLGSTLADLRALVGRSLDDVPIDSDRTS
jgi:hypothetical protein